MSTHIGSREVSGVNFIVVNSGYNTVVVKQTMTQTTDPLGKYVVNANLSISSLDEIRNEISRLYRLEDAGLGYADIFVTLYSGGPKDL